MNVIEIEQLPVTAFRKKIVRHGSLLFFRGQTARGSAGARGDSALQTHEALARIDALLAEAGCRRSHVVSAIVYLRNLADVQAMNMVWEFWLPAGPWPARAVFERGIGPADLLVEITVIVDGGHRPFDLMQECHKHV